jgi:hypothetical protein
MKVTHAFAAAAFGAALLTGCITAPTGGSLVAHYDGGYGQYHGGFWGRDGHFYYYTDATQSKFVRDNAGHFQPFAKVGYHQVRARHRERGYQKRLNQQQAQQAGN